MSANRLYARTYVCQPGHYGVPEHIVPLDNVSRFIIMHSHERNIYAIYSADSHRDPYRGPYAALVNRFVQAEAHHDNDGSFFLFTSGERRIL
jgi:hypothetical protein